MGGDGGHERIDQRSLAMHRAIAAKLREDPALLDIAFENIARWRPTAAHATPYLDSWEALLRRPLEEVLALIQEDSETMRAMRQSNPFAGILTPKERWEIYDAFAIGTYNPSSCDDRRR